MFEKRQILKGFFLKIALQSGSIYGACVPLVLLGLVAMPFAGCAKKSSGTGATVALKPGAPRIRATADANETNALVLDSKIKHYKTRLSQLHAMVVEQRRVMAICPEVQDIGRVNAVAESEKKLIELDTMAEQTRLTLLNLSEGSATGLSANEIELKRVQANLELVRAQIVSSAARLSAAGAQRDLALRNGDGIAAQAMNTQAVAENASLTTLQYKQAEDELQERHLIEQRDAMGQYRKTSLVELGKTVHVLGARVTELGREVEAVRPICRRVH